MAQFPSAEWILALMVKLNEDEKYGKVARNWEGDMIYIIEPGGALEESIYYYLDLWHGKCRDAYVLDVPEGKQVFMTLKGTYPNYVSLLKGEVEPMQALLTRRVGVQGNMTVLMRNVPTVLEFVRCCREITDGFL